MTRWIALIACVFLVNQLGAEKWANQTGNQACYLYGSYAPKSPDELRTQVKSIASQGNKIRVIGNGYSVSDIGCTEGCHFSLRYLNTILSIDSAQKLVRVEAGITLADLNVQLNEKGLALPNQPGFAQFTLGGALSTGVHGTGHTGTLSSFVREVQLITADGECRLLSAVSDPEAFAAARLGLGSLGVIYAVTLQCVPVFNLQLIQERIDYETMIANYKELNRSNEFVQFFWHAETGAVTINRWNRSTENSVRSDQALTWYMPHLHSIAI